MADSRTGKRKKFDRTTQDENDLTLEDAFNTFYHAKIAEGRSARTLQMYRENIGYLRDFMDAEDIALMLANVTPELLRSYMGWLLNDKRKWDGHPHKIEANMTVGLSPVSVNTRMKTLRTMFKFLADEGKIGADPSARVKKASEPEKEIRVMSVEDLRKLMAAPDQRSYAGFRDTVAMNVLLDSFARIGEVLTLKRSNVDFKTRMLSLDENIVKTRQGRHVPITARTAKMLAELLRETEEFESEYVFLANHGEPLTDDQFRNRLKLHVETAGLDVRIYPHLFRHTAATLFLENGGEARHLAKILGHRDLRMVMRYTHLSDRSMQSQHDAYSPINNIVGKLEKGRKIKR